MPLDQFLKDYTPGDDFDFEAFRASVATEYEKDQTAWRAAVTTRDATIQKTNADLTKAQAAAWEAHNTAPVTNQQIDDTPDENSPEALRSRIFKPIERK